MRDEIQFVDIREAADEYIGRTAVETPIDSSVFVGNRLSVLSQRIKQLPATGHPSRLFDQRTEKSVNLKALVAPINYNLYDTEFGHTRSGATILIKEDLVNALRSFNEFNDKNLWVGNDTHLTQSTSPEYFGVAKQIDAADSPFLIGVGENIGLALRVAVFDMTGKGQRPTAIYLSPFVLGALRAEHPLGNVYSTVRIGKDSFTTIETSAGFLPLIPEWALGEQKAERSEYKAYILNEDLVEYHWLSDPNPRLFLNKDAGPMNNQNVLVKFGAVVVKSPGLANRQVIVTR